MRTKLRKLIWILPGLILPLLSFGPIGQDNQGNPIPHFLFPKFEEGVVVMKDGTSFRSLINYNMVDEKMITEVEGVYRYSTNPRAIESVTIQNRVFIPMSSAFFEILSTGNVNFFLQHKASLTPKGNEVGYGVVNRSTGPTKMQRYELTNVCYQYGEVVNIELPQNVEITRTDIYWVSTNEMLEQFNSQKQFLKLFPSYEAELKNFIKAEKINLKDRDDIIRLGNYCNMIMMQAAK